MQTYSFIGSDKNAGKTTALTYVYSTMQKKTEVTLCVSGVGINGEARDQLDGSQKPSITLLRGTYFVTSVDLLHKHTGKYQAIWSFTAPQYRGHFVLGRCMSNFKVILEGPNTGFELLAMKKRIKALLPEDSFLLLDGSIDRQFLAHPEISDMFYFSVLFSSRKAQRQKAEDLLLALRLPAVAEGLKKSISSIVTSKTKSLLIDADKIIHHHGSSIPYSDRELHLACRRLKDQQAYLYINGALSQSLYTSLAPLVNLEVVLDNFTQYQSISLQQKPRYIFRPRLSLLHPVKIKQIFLKEEANFDPRVIPEGVPVCNLYRDIGRNYAA